MWKEVIGQNLAFYCHFANKNTQNEGIQPSQNVCIRNFHVPRPSSL